MDMKLKDKVALVTGGASGIGGEICRRFGEEGAKVSVVDMNLEAAKQMAGEIAAAGRKAIAVECDVSEEEQANAAVQRTERELGKVNILVNCAGHEGANFIADMSTEEWRRIFAVHCDGTFFFTRAVLQTMGEGDRIINISSIDAVGGQVFGTHYAAAKGAIVSFTKSLSLEVSYKGITVNAIGPGVIRTRMGNLLVEVAPPDFPDGIPSRRYGEPSDIAALAVFLASPEASYITGQMILVDGGITLANPVNRFTAKLMGMP
jgi:NAD(P)-dependent dehydrogenase (short-subunit alcohol dehydrogenase family)